MRIKAGKTTRKRHKKYLKQAKGYRMGKHALYRHAREQVEKSGQYAYRDRRQKKRDMRSLWVTRIGAACRLNGISYSKFIKEMRGQNVVIDRKMLSELAISTPEDFAKLVGLAKEH